MALLVAFAFVAGAATALSPCVLPVLPVALSAGATGGRRRPLGVVCGLVLAFTFATVGLVYAIAALGLPDGLLRTVAIAVLAGFGLALVFPRLAVRLEAPLSRVGGRRLRHGRGDGLGSGLLLGAGLGLVYAPCAGPILAGVITVSAAQELTAARLAVALAYAAGAAVVLYAVMLGGRRVVARAGRRSGSLRAAMGVVMVGVAAAMAAELDIRFQESIADDLPAALVNPSGALETSAAARGPLADLRGGGGGVAAAATRRRGDGAALPVLGVAPEIRGTQRWFNTPRGSSLSLASLRGRVVLIDFWTYSCINCLRTMPFLRAWDARYHDAGLTVVGVHAPEFAFERDAGNVGRAIRANRLRYPVVQDNEFATWRAYGNQFWPAKYLIDARGRVRYAHFGEGAYGETEAAIRSLLAEAGRRGLGARVRARAERAGAHVTPEAYLGTERGERVVNGPVAGTVRFALPAAGARAIPRHHLALEGRWRRDGTRAVAADRGARLHLRFAARDVFLVLGVADHARGSRRVDVLLDGRRRGSIRVTGHRLYDVVRLPEAGEHLLTLAPQRGTEAYAFTFG